MQLVNHSLHPRPAHADAGADRIDRRIPRDDCDLGPRARVARDRLYLDDAVIDFRHLLREELGHELRMRPREENLRTARLTPHIVDVGADAISVAEQFTWQQLVAPYDRLAAAEIGDDVAVLNAFDDTIDDVADAILEFLVLAVAFGIAHLLDDHLLCRLGRNASIFEWRQRLGDVIAHSGSRITSPRILNADVDRVVFDLICDKQQARQPHLASLRIDFGAHLGFAPITRAGRLLNGVLHSGDDDAAVDRLFSGDRIGDLQQFEPIRADDHRSFSFRLTRCRRCSGSVFICLALTGSVIVARLGVAATAQGSFFGFAATQCSRNEVVGENEPGVGHVVER